MFYRYEASLGPCPGTFSVNVDGERHNWMGICTVMNPAERRKLAWRIHEPKWYEKHPSANSSCWFTEAGYAKYAPFMEEIIGDMVSRMSLETLKDLRIRVICAENIENLFCKGKIQVVAPWNVKGKTIREVSGAEIYP